MVLIKAFRGYTRNRIVVIFITVLYFSTVILCGCNTGEIREEESSQNSINGPTSLDQAETIVIDLGNETIPTTFSTSLTAESAISEEDALQDHNNQIIGSVFTTDNVRLRSAPSADSEIIEIVKLGQELALLKTVHDEWAEVLWNDEVAYISKRYITEDQNWREHIETKNGFKNGDPVGLNPDWKYAGFSEIHSGCAILFTAMTADRKNVIIGVNAGHGTKGGANSRTYCHPDKTPKVTGGSTAAGATMATAVSSGMTFNDGTPERVVTLRMAHILKDILLENGYDVLMLRNEDDVQLDNVARTVMCNNVADCHIAIHWDGDGLDYDKGCFYMSVPDSIKSMEPVASTWEKDELLGEALIAGLREQGVTIFSSGNMDMDLTQTSFSSVPSVDIELGNQCSNHSDTELYERAYGMLIGINGFFGY